MGQCLAVAEDLAHHRESVEKEAIQGLHPGPPAAK